jgi:hypothetical protein
MRKKLHRLFWKLIWKLRKRRFCRNVGYRCPDCIFHDFVFDGSIFRGNRCRYPRRY